MVEVLIKSFLEKQFSTLICQKLNPVKMKQVSSVKIYLRITAFPKSPLVPTPNKAALLWFVCSVQIAHVHEK